MSALHPLLQHACCLHLLRIKAALREHMTWGRLRLERKTFLASAQYPQPRFDAMQIWAPVVDEPDREEGDEAQPRPM